MKTLYVLFCNIPWMKYYRGVTADDKPVGGGAFIKKYGDGADVTNFLPHRKKFYGYVMTRTIGEDKYAQIRLENFDKKFGKDVTSVNGVLVIWVASKQKSDNMAYVVGWYKNATVHRDFQSSKNYTYNIEAESSDVVLLPLKNRNWAIPRAGRNGNTHGLGQSNFWYAKHPDSKDIVDDIISKISSYDGKNWVNSK